jgi:hypothetical protein
MGTNGKRLSHTRALPATAWMDKTPELRLSSIFRRLQSYSEGRLMAIFDDRIEPFRILGSTRT